MTDPNDHFPLLEIEGGPHGHGIKMSLDGVPMKAVTKFVLRGSATDVMVLYTRQIVRTKSTVKIDHEENL